MILGLLRLLFLDKRARRSLEPASPPTPGRATAPRPEPPRERTPAEALAEAEERMKRLPPEKAQLVRTARLIHQVRQSALAELDEAERERLRALAEKAFGGPGRKG